MSLVGATIVVAVLSMLSAVLVLGLKAAEMQATAHLDGGRGPAGARSTADGDARVSTARLVAAIRVMPPGGSKGEKSNI
ncbi:MAG: hypothetical protein QNJ87_17595 [Gammaproteobacteria bacterium]|nr:hypothetical protein [Gammaproteobacteria bacterium]